MSREQIKEQIQHLWCQHCKALQKSNNTVVECWYNPMNKEAPAFCAANEDMLVELLKIIESLGYRPPAKLKLIDSDAKCDILNAFYEKYHPSVKMQEAVRVAVDLACEAQLSADQQQG